MSTRETFKITIYKWAQGYINKGICPVCMQNKIRIGHKTCSPKCNQKFYVYCCDVFDWAVLRRQILDRDGHKCVQCDSTDRLEVDHIQALALGGTNHIENLQTLCSECHKKKTKQDIAQINYQKYKRLGIEEFYKK